MHLVNRILFLDAQREEGQKCLVERSFSAFSLDYTTAFYTVSGKKRTP